MYKFLSVVFSLLFLSTIAFAGKTEVAVQAKQNHFNTKLKKQLLTDTNKAKVYSKKADAAKAAGKIEFANAYQNCAKAKTQSAEAIQNYMNAKNTAESICKTDDALSPIAADTLNYYKKGERLTTRIKKLNQCSKECLDKATVAKNLGKTDLAEKYTKLSKELQSMGENIQEYKAGKKNFKCEHGKVISLKKKVKC